MTIKQHGGIFGRNPTFNDLEANNLDVDALGIGASANSTNILELSGAAPIMKVTAENGQSGFRLNVSGAGSNTLRVQQDGASKLELNGNNIKINSGSLQFATSGQGIDFSATGGSGTSELLDDYEEGTWTPTNQSSVVINTIHNATYTKSGRSVTVSAWLKVNPTSPNFIINGLPFTVSGRTAGLVINQSQNEVLATQILSTSIYVYGGTTTGTDDNMLISVTYDV